MKTLKGFILAASIFVSIIFFGGTYLVVSQIYDKSVKENALYVSNTLAELTFSSMFQVMNKGWKRAQLEEFIASTRKAVADTPTTIEVFRGEGVSQLFGVIPQENMDEAIKNAFQNGAPVMRESAAGVRYVYPIKAQDKCLRCHENAGLDEVLGVIDVRQDLTPFISKAKNQFLFYLLLLAPIPLIIALLVVLRVNRKIEDSMAVLEDSIERVNKVSDLRTLELGEIRTGFGEFDRIFHKVEELTGKLKSVAVDKDLLEFEIKLLEKFVITSEVVKDWRDYVSRLLIDINTIINAYTLFSIFKVDDEIFDLEIFWRSAPSDKTKSMLERTIHDTMQENPHFAGITSINIVHNIAHSGGPEIHLEESDIEVQVKSLLVEAPKIGGIVGIGVQAEIVRDETRFLVMESILSTLLNVVGSVKAIYKYTKDLEYYATRDPLTNLYNQRVFWEMLEYEKGRAERHHYKFALLMIDLDNFKTVNDTYGHAFGDKFLREFAGLLKKVLRTEDIIARYGGDEFVAILPESDLEQAASITTRLLEAINASFLPGPDGTNVKGTASIGLAVFPDHADEQKDLFLFADNMMYKAKAQGKSRVSIPTEEDMLEVFRDIGEKSIIIINAVEEKKVIPFFQPILNVKEKRVEAVEVLSRIELADGRILGAIEFVEIAEKMGIIHKMDYIIMEKALQTVQESGYQGLVFLNLSPRALVLNEFLHEARRIVTNSGIAPERIVLEITERDTVRNMALLERFVNDLKMEGFKLAIDDFGSGFSSFHYLKHFPIDVLKIEGDFIANMLKDGKDRAFVKSISMLAQELGIRTVAEYVESEEVLESVAASGIDLAQGYHIGRPMPKLVF